MYKKINLRYKQVLTIVSMGIVWLTLYTPVYAIDDPTKITLKDLINLGCRLVGFAAIVLPSVATLILIFIAGFYYIIARGNAGKMAQAKQTATYAVIGFVIIMFAGLIMTLLSNTFGFELEYLFCSASE